MPGCFRAAVSRGRARMPLTIAYCSGGWSKSGQLPWASLLLRKPHFMITLRGEKCSAAGATEIWRATLLGVQQHWIPRCAGTTQASQRHATAGGMGVGFVRSKQGLMH